MLWDKSSFPAADYHFIHPQQTPDSYTLHTNELDQPRGGEREGEMERWSRRRQCRNKTWIREKEIGRGRERGTWSRERPTDRKTWIRERDGEREKERQM